MEPWRAASEACTSLAMSARVSWRSLARASCRTWMTVCWSAMIWRCSWFSVRVSPRANRLPSRPYPSSNWRWISCPERSKLSPTSSS